MAFERISIELAIPKKVWDKIPLNRKIAFRDEVRALKTLAVKVNEGLPNEEMTVKGSRHLCRHDEGKECDPEVEI